MSVPANERQVRMGGLYRCCLLTISETTTLSEIGDVLSCKYHDNPDNEEMIVGIDGIWEWNHRE